MYIIYILLGRQLELFFISGAACLRSLRQRGTLFCRRVPGHAKKPFSQRQGYLDNRKHLNKNMSKLDHKRSFVSASVTKSAHFSVCCSQRFPVLVCGYHSPNSFISLRCAPPCVIWHILSWSFLFTLFCITGLVGTISFCKKSKMRSCILQREKNHGATKVIT